MRICLLDKRKLGFVDGRFPKTRFEPELHDQWEKVNVVVLSWIMNSVRPGMLSSVLYASDAHKVWEDLKKRFDKVNGSRFLYLHREIHNLTQGTMTIADYFSKLKNLWGEFNALMPCPTCHCPEYKKYAQHFEAYRLLQFLQSMLVTEGVESIELCSNKGNGGSGGNYKFKKNQVQCEYCHFKGHTKENYYKLIGYPHDFKTKKKGHVLTPGLYTNGATSIDFTVRDTVNMNTQSYCALTQANAS
ncbi:uncharacterized protein LOC142173480 [Nicotiana tabacum]|uniref:Uncharacterized protein LOC142173480 n=1 Tax=Nicotiana tabacum TaxID=4097 RepID=A0AC58TD79_TOBAC